MGCALASLGHVIRLLAPCADTAAKCSIAYDYRSHSSSMWSFTSTAAWPSSRSYKVAWGRDWSVGDAVSSSSGRVARVSCRSEWWLCCIYIWSMLHMEMLWIWFGHDLIWYGYDMIWIWFGYGMIWYDLTWIWYDLIWIWYDMDMVWYDMIWFDMDVIWIWYGYDMIWYGIDLLLMTWWPIHVFFGHMISSATHSFFRTISLHCPGGSLWAWKMWIISPPLSANRFSYWCGSTIPFWICANFGAVGVFEAAEELPALRNWRSSWIPQQAWCGPKASVLALRQPRLSCLDKCPDWMPVAYRYFSFSEFDTFTIATSCFHVWSNIVSSKVDGLRFFGS